MAVEGVSKCVKYLLFVFNLLFFVSGLGLVIVGALAQANVGAFGKLSDNATTGAPVLLIVVGSIILVVAFFGCFGSIKENRCMLGTFTALLVIILLVEIAAGIAAFVFKDKINGYFSKDLKDLYNKYPSSASDAKVIDDMQQKLKCCGASNYTEWLNYNVWNQDPVNHGNTPDSCCVNVTTGCGKGEAAKPDKIYTDACVPKLETELKKSLVWIGAVVLGIGLAQIIGVILACCLMKGIKDTYETF
ncbi:CD63 antigen-like [Lethenteron reissneri]|uniref:CD63 antigen-like n=1 Tax=Lethenteron reissneri TaxID=7753 RepID=UPI002AB7C634|nr:CD63 antigen-like [Lethenteron reissneri]XP_061419468.1 CD63 antigen-like [Lethenteron reissneri]